jgi:FtsH-binding integral membrane protein
MNSESFNSAIPVSEVSPVERAAFIRKTYGHLAGAVLVFIALELVLFQTGMPKAMIEILGTSRYSWLIVIGGFMAVSWVAEKLAVSDASSSVQYAGLGLYVVAEAIFFMPLLYIASRFSSPEVIPMAGIITALLFGGLTFTAFTTKSDFSFMRTILVVGSFVAMWVIIASVIFGFTLGLLFSAVMVLFAAGCILYTTGQILHRYNTSQHVAASLSLFASVALMFWYVLRILMSLNRR